MFHGLRTVYGMPQTHLRQVQGDAMKFLQEPDLGTCFELCFSADAYVHWQIVHVDDGFA